MSEGEDAGVGVVRVGDGLEAKVSELGGDFSGALRGFGFELRARQNSRAEWSHGGFLEREKRDIGEVYEGRD